MFFHFDGVTKQHSQTVRPHTHFIFVSQTCHLPNAQWHVCPVDIRAAAAVF
ncbi:Uncharacterised protein [Vibrio cholerae]|nr:Uncharacterised protein [Vibrio cholerae]